MRRCVRSENRKNGEAMTRVGSRCHSKKVEIVDGKVMDFEVVLCIILKLMHSQFLEDIICIFEVCHPRCVLDTMTLGMF
jgi:hypothetical protein